MSVKEKESTVEPVHDFNDADLTQAVGSRSCTDDTSMGGTDIITATKDCYHGRIFRAIYEFFYSRGWFWILCTLLILIEPILCAYDPYTYPKVFNVQIAVLVGSTACLGVQLVGNIVHTHIDGDNKGKAGTKQGFVIWEGSFVLEFFCILCGWVFIFYRPGGSTSAGLASTHLSF
jgi:hypothetical protein